MRFYFCLILFRIISAYDCEEICNVTVGVTENAPPEVLKWNLVDLIFNRTASSENLQFSLSNPSDYFVIESRMLEFRGAELDRESICNKISINDECFLQLQIFTQTSFIVIFKMVILDENDWRPHFNQDYVHLNIRENLPTNYRVQLPVAVDADSNQYDIDHYEFLNNTEDIERIFQLEESDGELQLKLLRKLNCEVMNNYQLYIIAIDKGGLKSNVLHVNITVGDLNEYQPRFSQQFYHQHVRENISVSNFSSSPILEIIATDDDCYDKTILYSIVNNDNSNEKFPFEIDKHTGAMRLKYSLDYETTSTYRFRVKASNLDEITASIVPVIIDVLDVNDNAPFIQINILNEYQLKEEKDFVVIDISENIRSGQVIGSVLIRDVDTAMINRYLSLKVLSCSSSGSSCPIELDSGLENSTSSSPTYIIRTLRSLDRELGDDKFLIILEARDHGDPSLSSQRRLLVNINDENDCAPKFTHSNYQYRLSQSAPVGSFIGQVHADDGDYSSKFRLTQYGFDEDEDQDFIYIDVNNGSLFLIKPLPTNAKLNITVKAMDQLNHSLYDRSNIQILLFNETTCSPMFRQTAYVFNTMEHRSTPYEIGQVNVDNCLLSSMPVFYHLITEDSLSSFPFSIDTYAGKINVIHELDREIQSSYKFHVSSFHPKTQRTMQAEVHVNVLDENDHAPVFDNSHDEFIYISTRHQRTNKLFITSIRATDADAGLNGLVNYYFTNKELYTYFHLYPNGSIVLYDLNDIQLPVRLEIYARDQGYPRPLSSKESVVIYLCDILKRHECPVSEVASKLRSDFYMGSIFIMTSIVVILFIIVVCTIWHLFARKQMKHKTNKGSYDCQVEARKNLIISDGIYDLSPTMGNSRRLKCVVI